MTAVREMPAAIGAKVEPQNIRIGKIVRECGTGDRNGDRSNDGEEDPIRQFRHLSPRVLAAIKRPSIPSGQPSSKKIITP
jgi:hypothetical protein